MYVMSYFHDDQDAAGGWIPGGFHRAGWGHRTPICGPGSPTCHLSLPAETDAGHMRALGRTRVELPEEGAALDYLPAAPFRLPPRSCRNKRCVEHCLMHLVMRCPGVAVWCRPMTFRRYCFCWPMALSHLQGTISMGTLHCRRSATAAAAAAWSMQKI